MDSKRIDEIRQRLRETPAFTADEVASITDPYVHGFTVAQQAAAKDIEYLLAALTDGGGGEQYVKCPDCIDGTLNAGCSIDKPLISVPCLTCRGTMKVSSASTPATTDAAAVKAACVEDAANVAFEAVMAVENSDHRYSDLQKAAQVAASIRTLLPLVTICVKCGHTSGVDLTGLCCYIGTDPKVTTWECGCKCELVASVTTDGLVSEEKHCGFCGKPDTETSVLIQTAVGYICKECVAICASIIERDEAVAPVGVVDTTIVEVIGPDGKVRCRRPWNDPDVQEAFNTVGHSVRKAQGVAPVESGSDEPEDPTCDPMALWVEGISDGDWD